MERKGFHRSDFAGSAGPGLAKLRAAKLEPEYRALPLNKRGSGLDRLRAEMAAGNWNDAILIAAKFPELGDEAAAIHRGREAIMRPYFQRQLKRDPELMRLEAIAALKARYGNV